MSIRKFRAARVTTTTASTFVGQVGDMFYDEATGQLKVSDGQTVGGHFVNLVIATSTVAGAIKAGPGANIATDGTLTINTAGLPLSFGDFSATGGNLKVVNTNEDLNLLSNGTGDVNVIGNLQVFSTVAGTYGYDNTPLVSVDNTNRMIINGNLITNGNVTTNGTLTTIGATYHTGNVTTNGNLIVNGTTAFNGAETIVGNLTIAGNLFNNGNTVNSGYTTNNGPLIQNGNVTLAGNIVGVGNITTTGTLSVNGPFLIGGMNLAAWSVTPAATMTGTTQAGAYQINTTIVEPTTVPANSGAKLPANSVPGSIVFIANDSGNPMNVYPPLGGNIDFGNTNQPFTLSAQGMWVGTSLAGNQWTTLNPDPQTADNNVIVTQGNGIVTFGLAPNVTIGNLTVNGTTTFNGNSIRNGNVTTNGNSIINGALTNNGATTNNGVLTQNGNIIINGNSTITGNTVQTGYATFVTTAGTNAQGGLDITGNLQGILGLAPQNLGVVIHATGYDDGNTPTRIYLDGVSQYAAYIGRRYNGTIANPVQVTGNSVVTRFGGTPYTSSGWPTISTTRVDLVTNEAQTSSAQGSRIEFWATANTTSTITRVATIDPGVGITTTGNVSANYFVGNGAALTGIATQSVGTWTPSFVFATQGTQTYSLQVGNYIKNGRQVTAYFSLTGATNTGGTGNFSIGMTGLPTPMTSTGAVGTAFITTQTISSTNVTSPQGTVSSAATSVPIFAQIIIPGGGGSITYRQMTQADLGATGAITGMIQYISAT
jgi:hypothetical protein